MAASSQQRCTTRLFWAALCLAKAEAPYHLHSHLYAQGFPTSKDSSEKQESAKQYLFGRMEHFLFSLALKKEKTCFEAGGEEEVGTSR